MTHLEPRPARHAGLFIRMVYWFARRRFGRVPKPLAIMAYSRPVLAAAAGYELAAERTSFLSKRLQALAEIKTATLVGCRFCIDIGAALARGHGVTEEDLRDLPFPAQSLRFTLLERQVLEYAEAMTSTPMVVPDGLFAALRDALGAPALVELTACIAWENHRARFNHAFGAKEEGYSERTVCLLAPVAPAASPPVSS